MRERPRRLGAAAGAAAAGQAARQGAVVAATVSCMSTRRPAGGGRPCHRALARPQTAWLSRNCAIMEQNTFGRRSPVRVQVLGDYHDGRRRGYFVKYHNSSLC